MIVVAHGSSDPHWQAPFEQLRQELQLLCPKKTIYLAFLERQSPGLVGLVENLYRQGIREIFVTLALMSGGGRHAKVDLPLLVDELQKNHADLHLHANFEALGQHPEVIRAMARACLEQAQAASKNINSSTTT